MYVDVTALCAFYRTKLGQDVQRTLQEELYKKDFFQENQISVGLGYSLPYVPEKKLSGTHLAFMPARQGAIPWAPQMEALDYTNNISVLVEEDLLPLKDNSIDAFLLIHSLEFSKNRQAMLEEVWRVLAPNGRVIIIVPNRKGLWAFHEDTPFGNGVPYSRTQLQNLLKGSGFSSYIIGETLYFSPVKHGLLGFLSQCHRGLIAAHLLYFGGVLVAEAQKDVFKGVTVKEPAKRKMLFNKLPLKTPTPEAI